MGRKDKQPKAAGTPAGKSPRFGADPGDANRQTPVWSVGRFDRDSRWGQLLCDREDALWLTVLPAMKNYETMTWNAILENKKYNHSVPVEDLIKPARDRLAELGMDDIDELFRFRIGGTGRVWGVRDGRVFQILWWDADHEVCPSAKK